LCDFVHSNTITRTVATAAAVASFWFGRTSVVGWSAGRASLTGTGGSASSRRTSRSRRCAFATIISALDLVQIAFFNNHSSRTSRRCGAVIIVVIIVVVVFVGGVDVAVGWRRRRDRMTVPTFLDVMQIALFQNHAALVLYLADRPWYDATFVGLWLNASKPASNPLPFCPARVLRLKLLGRKFLLLLGL
jgi:hypothetical protein